MDCDTVFVRGLAPGVNNEELKELFSEVGPVKDAFLVAEKDGPNKGKSRGFGFVQFALSEDAEEAVKKLQGRSLADSKLILALAEKRGFKHDKSSDKKKNKRKTQPGEQAALNALGDQQQVDSENKAGKGKKKSESIFEELARNSVVTKGSQDQESTTNDETFKKTVDLLRECSTVVFNLPPGTKESDLRKKAGKAGKVNMVQIPYHCGEPTFPFESRSGLIVYTKRTSVSSAIVKLSGKRWNFGQGESLVHCRRVSKVAHNPKSKERCRLIVRNVAFDATKQDLMEAFESFGPILEVKIPTEKVDNKSRGFAFVQFACRNDAEKALKEVNGKQLGRRVVAVDWALNKKVYDKITHAPSPEEQSERNKGHEATENDKVEAEEEEEEDDQDDEGVDHEEKENESEHGEVDEEGSEDDEEGSEEEIDASEGEDDMASDEDEEEEEEEEKNRGPDPDELSSTLFLRNLLFESTQEEVFEAFKKFGPIRYVKITKGPDGRSRGSGFVNFYKRESLEKALQEAETVPLSKKNVWKKAEEDRSIASVRERGGNGITLAGRPLLVTVAVDKKLAKQIQEHGEKEKVKSDKRHLYLAKEGVILAEGETELPASDMRKRERAEKEKKTKLANPMFFVSPTRLSVRNLFVGSKDGSADPVTEKDMKQVFLKAAKEGLKRGLVGAKEGDSNLFPLGWPDRANIPPPKILQAKILRDDLMPSTKELDEGQQPAAKVKKGVSKGFGFVEFSEHVHALAALRLLNNNPAYAFLASGGPKSMKVSAAERSRLIVEFAVENASKLRARKERLKKFEEKNRLEANAKKALAFAAQQREKAANKSNNRSSGDLVNRQGGKHAEGKKRKRQDKSDNDKQDKGNKKQRTTNNNKKDNNNNKKDNNNNKKDNNNNKKDINNNKKDINKKKKDNNNKKDKDSSKKRKMDNKGQTVGDYRDMVEQYKKNLFSFDDSGADAATKKQKRWFDVE